MGRYVGSSWLQPRLLIAIFFLWIYLLMYSDSACLCSIVCKLCSHCCLWTLASVLSDCKISCCCNIVRFLNPGGSLFAVIRLHVWSAVRMLTPHYHRFPWHTPGRFSWLAKSPSCWETTFLDATLRSSTEYTVNRTELLLFRTIFSFGTRCSPQSRG